MRNIKDYHSNIYINDEEKQDELDEKMARSINENSQMVSFNDMIM